jgi:hypothetical protein
MPRPRPTAEERQQILVAVTSGEDPLVVGVRFGVSARYVLNIARQSRPAMTEPPVEAPEVTELYRFYDEGECLLYVGISFSAVARMASHKCEKIWFRQVTKITIERYATRQDALDAEATAIREERPAWNVSGTASNPNSFKNKPKRLRQVDVETVRDNLPSSVVIALEILNHPLLKKKARGNVF